jgi:sortase A
MGSPELAERTPQAETDDAGVRAARGSRRRRFARRLGATIIVLGVLFLAYGAAVYFWRDPITDLYQRWKQDQLASTLEKSFREFQPVAISEPAAGAAAASSDDGVASEEGGAPAAADAAAAAEAEAEAARQAVAADARRFQAQLKRGQALGRIRIPELGLKAAFVHGTRWGADLTRGPGHYEQTSLPGLDKVTAIAGHRTTFGAPFRHIDDLKAGDLVVLEVPYGTFTYRVTGHEIVEDDDWSIIRERGFDRLVLSACHPLFSASQRWIVYARLIKVERPTGEAYRLVEGEARPISASR